MLPQLNGSTAPLWHIASIRRLDKRWAILHPADSKLADRLKTGGLRRWRRRFDALIAAVVLSLVGIEKEVEREKQGL